MSIKDRLLRKKYIGVWRQESILIKTTRHRFQVSVVIYRMRNITKSSAVIWGKSENPRRMNWVISVMFLPLIIASVILVSIEEEKKNTPLTQVKFKHFLPFALRVERENTHCLSTERTQCFFFNHQ